MYTVFGLLIAEVAVNIRSVGSFVTTGRPASAAASGAVPVIASADFDVISWKLLLEVALETEVRIALGEHFLIH